MKIYQIVACLDEGVMNSWLFRAQSEWHVAAYIVEHYWDYPEIFKELGLDEYSRYEEEEPIKPEVLLNAISESHIDGDSAYGYEIFEADDEDIISTNNEHLVPTEDYKLYLNHFTGHKNYPYKTFLPFHQVDGYVINKLGNFKWHRFEKENNYQGFAEWLAKATEINENELVTLGKLAEESGKHNWGATIFDKLAKFTVPLVNLAAIPTFSYNVFYDRLLEGLVGEHFFKGRIALMIGKGHNEPSRIDFVLHYSSFVGSPNSHPYVILIAQMLTAMSAQNLSTLKGAYVLNSSWHFYILEKDAQNVVHIHEYKSLYEGRLEYVKDIYRFIKAFQQENEE